jgi:hypothetical protein
MVGPERIEWRRSFPIRTMTMFGWYLAAALVVLAGVWLLFGSEPARLASGQANPLAAVPLWTAGLAVVGALVLLLPAVRRPVVAANHFALRVRPGMVRILRLPWSDVVEVAAETIDGTPFLLVRYLPSSGSLGERPGWWDRSVLREAIRASRGSAEPLRGYDLAVRLSDFAGRPDGQLATLAAYAPDQVVFSNRL